MPQSVPSATLPLSVQTGAPVAHEMAAVWHGLVEGHTVPAVHALQLWLASQTRFVPQLAPGALNVRSVHTGAPEPHAILAVSAQAELTAHVWFSVHATHE